MRRLLPLLTVAAAACLITPDTDARRIKTSHKIQKTSVRNHDGKADDSGAIILTEDSTAVWDGIKRRIRFYGFDKTAGSPVESLFITNGLDSILRGVEIDITYLDMQGRQLHRQSIELDCTVAPGETMRSDFKTWDTQKSFYFHQSAPPRRQSTPFDVRIELRSVSLDTIHR